MRVAVAGGAGFVGRHVVERLLDRGAQVITLDLRAPAIPFPREEVVIGDLSRPERALSVAHASGPIDAVVWLAASIRHHRGVDETADSDLAVMVEGPFHFLKEIAPPPATMVYLSSIQVYGAPRRLPVDEDHPTDPSTAYGVAKLCAEDYLRIACRSRGVSLAVLRAAFIYGPGQHPGNVIPRFLEAVRRGESPVVRGEGKEVRDDVHVADVARAVEMAIDRRLSVVVNVASGRPHTLLEVAECACRLAPTGLRPRHEAVDGGWTDRWFSVDRARDLLGFVPGISFEEGLRGMWERGIPR